MSDHGYYILTGDGRGYFACINLRNKSPAGILVCRVDALGNPYYHEITETLYDGPDNPGLGWVREIVDHIPIEEVPPLIAHEDRVVRTCALRRLAQGR
jgi:hypothetical protein